MSSKNKQLIPVNPTFNQYHDNAEDTSYFNKIKNRTRYAKITSVLGAMCAHNLYTKFITHPLIKQAGIPKNTAVRASYGCIISIGLFLGALIGLIAKLIPKKYPSFFSPSPKALSLKKPAATYSHSGLTRRDQFKIELAKLKRPPRCCA